MIKTPTRIKDARRFFDSLDLNQIEASIAREARARLIIVGPVNSGKSTLFNQLKGQKLSEVSAVPGTTTAVHGEQFGPFTLLDTPGLGEVAGAENAQKALDALTEADVAVLVLDAMAGIRQSDADLHRDIAAMGIPVVVALNKIDLIRKDVERVVKDAERKMGVPIIPISAKKGTHVAEQLIPAIIDSHPQMAVTIGRALPRFRRMAAGRVIRESAALAAIMGAEPVPGLDVPLMIGVQVRMLLRLGAIYGEGINVSRAQELVGAIAGGIAIRYGIQEVLKLVPGPGWLIAAVVATTGTVALGNVAAVFFEHGQNLNPRQLRELYKKVRWRRKVTVEELVTEGRQ